jgi:D-3-phosphoglycerate dehydrogenase / 2-oxoglutarate reductase
MKPQIWYEFTVDPHNRQRLEDVADVVSGGAVTDYEHVAIVVIGSIINADGSFMDSIGPSLKAIVRPGIGVDNVDIAAATLRGIIVLNTPNAPTESTAEHAVALLMAVAKRVVTGSRILQGADHPRTAMFGTELRARTLGIIGFGRIGRRVAEICGLGLRMKLIAYDPFVGDMDQPGVDFTTDLDYLLHNSDFVTLHIPLTPTTHHLIGEEQIRSMKPGSYLINAARGPVVDELALIRALADGHLAGAGLDVFDPEPPAPDNPLLHMDNVVCTPHVASYTDLGSKGMRDGVTDQILQLLAGERPTYIVNVEAWPGRLAYARK